jgi:hypothetical protein
MKIVYPMASVEYLKRRKLAKSAVIGNIAQSYMELLRLRGQVHELEGKRSYGDAARPTRGRLRSNRPHLLSGMN